MTFDWRNPFAPTPAQPFGPDAGFPHARNGGTIWLGPCDDLDLDAIIEPWNRLAGRTLFARHEFVPRLPNVTFTPHDSVTWVSVTGPSGYLGPYTSATVHYATTQVETIQHELGHVLGFADHIPAAEYPGRFTNPAVCDDRSHAAYSRYRGVMSYCTQGSHAFGRDDRASLRAMGYA